MEERGSRRGRYLSEDFRLLKLSIWTASTDSTLTCPRKIEEVFRNRGVPKPAAFAKFLCHPEYLRNNTYLQQQDNKKPSDNYFSDIHLGAL